MFIKKFSIIYYLIIMKVIFYQTQASKCGGFICDEKSECIYNEERAELNCVCDEGLIRNIQGRNINCYLPDLKQCLNVGDQCGAKHTCNSELICQETNDKNVEAIDIESKGLVCTTDEQECLHKCCLGNEICQNGEKCISKISASEVLAGILNEDCSEAKKCQDKCCAQNELCNEQNVCVSEEIPNVVNVTEDSLCLESQKCPNKCCAKSGICANENECVSNSTEFEIDCPESQKCLNKCCTLTELCQNDNECIAKEPLVDRCPKEQFCLDRCCAKYEICSSENMCVAKNRNLFNESVPTECPESQQCQNEKCNKANECVAQETTILECPESLKCLDKCCAEDEVCSSGNECVSQEDIAANCSDSQKCKNICCNLNQICNKESLCEEAVTEQDTTASRYTNMRDSLTCPETQICLEKCCSEHEKCTEMQECVPVDIIDCHAMEICGNKCCPINETCNDDNECVAFLELTTTSNCPQEQSCLNNCCSPQQVCNEVNECVNKNFEELSTLYDYSDEVMTDQKETTLSIDPIVTIYYFDDNKKYISCPKDDYPCQQKCCNAQQICNSKAECVEKLSSKVTACAFGENCTENSSITSINASTAYTIIGLGCLVTVLSFALFKVYNFRRSKRNVF